MFYVGSVLPLHVILQFEMKTTASAKANTKFSGGKIACLDPILLPFFTRKTITIFYTDHLTRNVCGFFTSLKICKINQTSQSVCVNIIIFFGTNINIYHLEVFYIMKKNIFCFPYANTAHIFSGVASIATVVSKILNNEPLLLNKKIRTKHTKFELTIWTKVRTVKSNPLADVAVISKGSAKR